MSWISFVCLLALSTVAFGYSLGGYSQENVRDVPVRPTLRLGNQYQSLERAQKPRRLVFDLPEPATLPLSEADILCKGKVTDSVILVNDGEKFIVCTTDGKGDEISCPKGLVYSAETRRCEYKVKVNENVCASQPCLFGGRCVPTQYSYECECTPGYSGHTCERDSSVCQQQQPCGQSLDSVCQSFVVGAALKHVCVLDNGRAYGSTGSEVFPNPCLGAEGNHPLAFGNKGFIKCAAKQMSIESCPGGTVWDPVNEACVWPDMEEGAFSLGAVEVPAKKLIEMPSKIELALTPFRSQESRMAAIPVQRAQSSSESGGFSGSLSSDDDFTERVEAAEFRPVQVAAQEAVPFSASRSRSSGDDFTSRLAGGEFQAAQAPGRRVNADRSSDDSSADFTSRLTGGEFQAAAAPGRRENAGRFRSSSDDFTSRLAGGEFQPAQAPGLRADDARVRGGSSLDFTRRFEGGDFMSTGRTRGEVRGTTGFPFARTPGASRNGQNQDNFAGPLIRGMPTDDSTGSSIRIPFRPSSSGSGEMERRGMLPSSFFSRPGEARRSGSVVVF